MPEGSRLRLLAGVLLAVFFLPGTHVLAQQGDYGNILGEVRIARGAQPPHRIKVTCHTRGIMVDTVYTDDNGRFHFLNLLGNLYTVVINEEGYAPVEQRVVVSPQTRANSFIYITLQPLRGDEKPVVGSGVEGGNPNVVDLASFKLPAEARKEYEKGRKAEAREKHDQAIRHYRRAIELAPDFYPARNNLGSVLLNQSKYDKAQAEFEAVIRLNQNDAAAYLNLGNLFLLTKRYGDALGPIQEGLRKQPDHPFGHFLLGTLYGRLGRFTECERSLREALRLDPTMSRPHLELVNLYMHQQRTTDAITELRQFLEVFPSDPFTPKAREVLSRLEGSSVQPQKLIN
jgi:Flp pilus assembly protein TadD